MTRATEGTRKCSFFLRSIKKSQNKGCFLAFFLFYSLKNKIKMHDLGSDWWEERNGDREEEGAGGGFGRDNKKYCTYNTFVLSPSASSRRFPHPLFPFFI